LSLTTCNCSILLRGEQKTGSRIADISNGISALAKELKVPMIIISQLNRELEDKNWKPRCRT
jgi:replicative DNA helicase